MRKFAPNSAGRAEALRGNALAARAPRPPIPARRCAAPRRESPDRRRAVSKLPGNRLLMVTLLPATLRAMPARKAVSPARAPLDKSSPASGIFTLSEVMLTMRPNLRAAMPSITRCTNSIGVTMFIVSPSRMALVGRARENRETAGRRCCSPGCRAPDTPRGVRPDPPRSTRLRRPRVTSTPLELRISCAAASSSVAVAAVDDQRTRPLRPAPGRMLCRAPGSMHTRWPCGREFPDP